MTTPAPIQVKLTSPVENSPVGTILTVSQARQDWLVAMGYAVVEPFAAVDRTKSTNVPASQDPTLAANREGPDAAVGSVRPTEDGKGKARAHDDREQLQEPRTTHEQAYVQEVADEESKALSSPEDVKGAVDTEQEKTNTEVAKTQQKADKHSEKVAKKGFNDHDQPGKDKVKVTDPAEPAS